MLSSRQSPEVLGIGVLRLTTGCLQLLKPDRLQIDHLENVVIGQKQLGMGFCLWSHLLNLLLGLLQRGSSQEPRR